ncbi:MAG: serine protease [Bacteroidia bacterium]|jgi:serine protease
MKHLLLYIAILTSSIGVCQTVDSSFVDGRLIARVNVGSTLNLDTYDSTNLLFNSVIQNFGVDSISNPFPGLTSSLDRTYRLFFKEASLIDSLVVVLTSLNEFDLIEKEPAFYVSSTPNDTKLSSQWHLEKIDVFNAWDVTKGDGTIKVAIVDNAVSTLHQDLKANIWNNPGETDNLIDDDLNGYTNDYHGYDVADNDNDPNPPKAAGESSSFTHGTHCAGISAGSTNNSLGIAGVGYNLTIIAVKCSPDNSDGKFLSNAYDGVYYAIQADADIISMSWGGSGGLFTTGQSIIQAASAAGIVLVAAAGNENTSQAIYPAAYSGVIAVGATDDKDNKANFSNFGSYIDIMAPGVQLNSCLSGAGNGYGYKSGTSMACPLVAGVAGLILTQNPTLSPAEVESKIKDNADNIDLINPTYQGALGAGRINAYQSLTGISAAIKKSSLSTNLNFYPNPTKGILNLNSKLDPTEITLTNSLGEVVNVVRKGNTLDLHNIPNGIFILRALTNEGWENHKIIKNE